MMTRAKLIEMAESSLLTNCVVATIAIGVIGALAWKLS
jgi:hypothetical protein